MNQTIWPKQLSDDELRLLTPLIDPNDSDPSDEGPSQVKLNIGWFGEVTARLISGSSQQAPYCLTKENGESAWYSLDGRFAQ